MGRVILLIVALGGVIASPALAVASQIPAARTPVTKMPTAGVSTALRPAHQCPADIDALAALMLRDLPSYANRVASRSLGLPSDRPSPFGAVIIASQPDLEPLDVMEPSFGVDSTSTIRQVFFTTLERQYLNNQAVSLQHYHWLFLVQGEDGWRPMRLYSALGSYPAGARTTPPQESSDGIIGQAVRLWLRDCRAGAVFPLEEATGE